MKWTQTFDNVDFTAIRPRAILAQGPERWPSAASLWHVLNVDDQKRFIVRRGRLDSNTLAASGTRGYDFVCVGAHDELLIVGRNWYGRYKDLAQGNF